MTAAAATSKTFILALAGLLVSTLGYTQQEDDGQTNFLRRVLAERNAAEAAAGAETPPAIPDPANPAAATMPDSGERDPFAEEAEEESAAEETPAANERLEPVRASYVDPREPDLPPTILTQRSSFLLQDLKNPNEPVGTIVMSDFTANEVLQILEDLTGKSILRRVDIPQPKISYESKTELTRRKAVIILESLLAINGIAVIRLGDDLLKAVPAANVIQNAPNWAPDDLRGAASQQIFSKFFNLEYLTLEEAVTLISPLLSQGQPQEFPRTKSLMITDSLVNLQRVTEVLSKADRPPAKDIEVMFFQLRNVSASDVSGRLETMQSGALKRYLENNTTFEADDRSNQLVVFTHPSNTDLIVDLVSKLDVDVAPLTRTEVFPLQHANAEEVTTLIEAVLTGQQRARDENQGATRTTTRSGQANRNATPDNTSDGGGNAQANAQVEASTAVSLADSKNTLQFTDFLNVVADTRGNSIIASGTNQDLLFLEDLIGKIDILLAQVEIEVVVVEVTLNKDQVRGIDSFSAAFNVDGDNEIDFDVNPPSTSRVSSPWDFSGTVKDFSISAVIDASRRMSNVEVLSTPRITTTHNREASIIVGESRPIITATQTDSSVTSSTRSTVQFRDIGIELTVTPLIGLNGNIQMEIDQTVDSVVGTVTIDNNEQPIIGTRQAKSFVSVGDSEIIVLGGLQEVNTTDSSGRMSFFGRIPVVGNLFTSKGEERQKRELLIFIQPTIIRDTAFGNEFSRERINQLESPEAVQEYLDSGGMPPLDPGKRTWFQKLTND